MDPEPPAEAAQHQARSSLVVLHGGALGDLVLTYHLLAWLRAAGHETRIDVVARSPLARWLAGRGVIHAAPDYESYGLAELFAESPSGAAPVFEKLREHDGVLSFLGGVDSAPARALEGAGLDAVHVDPRPTAETLTAGRHITEQWAAAWIDRAGRLGWPAARPAAGEPAAVRLSDDELRAARARLAAIVGPDRRPTLIVHPGSGGKAKCYPVDGLEAVIERLSERGWGIAWMVGPTELDWYGRGHTDRLGRTAPVICEEDLGGAAELAGAADGYLGNDAGMTHVAALVGARTVALFGPTIAGVWHPLGQAVRTLQGDTGFRPLSVNDILTAVDHITR